MFATESLERKLVAERFFYVANCLLAAMEGRASCEVGLGLDEDAGTQFDLQVLTSSTKLSSCEVHAL